MQIFALISQKGGAGKSTLARQLAVLAGEEGASILIDRDPQETTTKWWQRRQDLQPMPAHPDPEIFHTGRSSFCRGVPLAKCEASGRVARLRYAAANARR